MPGEFDMDAAVSDVGAGLGFGDDSNSDGGDDDLGLGETVGTEGAGESGEAGAPSEPPATKPPAPAVKEPVAGAPTSPPATAESDYPKTWRKEVSAHWASLPSEVKSEILRREGDIFQGLETYKVDANLGKSVKSIVAPYESILRAQNIDPLNIIQGLMQSHHVLATGTPQQKQELLQRIVRDYRIDASAFGQPAGEPPYVDPAVAALQTELGTIKSQLSAVEQQRVDQRRAEVSKQVDAFASDTKNIYWADVADDMTQLLAKGVVGTLQEAYDRAVWANPVTREKEIARTAAEKSEKAAAAAKAKAESARLATAANVKTRARTGGAAAVPESLDDTLVDTLATIRARG